MFSVGSGNFSRSHVETLPFESIHSVPKDYPQGVNSEASVLVSETLKQSHDPLRLPSPPTGRQAESAVEFMALMSSNSVIPFLHKLFRFQPSAVHILVGSLPSDGWLIPNPSSLRRQHEYFIAGDCVGGRMSVFPFQSSGFFWSSALVLGVSTRCLDVAGLTP